MLFLLFGMFLAEFLPPFIALYHFVLLIKLLLMDKTEAKRTRQKERAIRCVVFMAVSLSVWIVLLRDEELHFMLSGMDVVILLLYGILLFVLPAVLMIWFIMALKRFLCTDKDSTESRRRRKIMMIVSACITWTVVPAEVVLAYIPLMSMPLM